MDLKILLEKLSPVNFPVGLGGCKNAGTTFDCCEYNITIFDDKVEEDSIIQLDGEFVKLHHGTLSETDSAILTQYQGMKILSDDEWNLRIFLSKISEKSKKISNSYLKSCLVDASIYATKAMEGIKSSDPFSSCWLKCAAFFIADAILLVNAKRPSPTHILEHVRGFKKNRINEAFGVVNQCIGIERATTSLLQRMSKSTVGFSDMVEANDHSCIIQLKYDYLIRNSLLTDCYFYLGYTNRNNFIKIKDKIHRKPELIHILKIAFDIESDQLEVERQASVVLRTANELVSMVKK
ncbi:MAG: hypothetical protein ACE1YX_03320 [Nitrosopumilaceae archaeon]